MGKASGRSAQLLLLQNQIELRRTSSKRVQRRGQCWAPGVNSSNAVLQCMTRWKHDACEHGKYLLLKT